MDSALTSDPTNRTMTMTLGLAFWLCMFLWLMFGLAWNWPGNSAIGPYGPIGNTVLLFLLFLILGWRVFGAPLHS